MASRATFALLCAAFVLLALCATTAADEACSADDGPISCESCREGADVNVRARCVRSRRGVAGCGARMGLTQQRPCPKRVAVATSRTSPHHALLCPVPPFVLE